MMLTAVRLSNAVSGILQAVSLGHWGGKSYW